MKVSTLFKCLLMGILFMFLGYCKKEPGSAITKPASSGPTAPAGSGPTVAVSAVPVSLNGAHDITISGKSINGGTVPDIELIDCYNIHITQNNLGKSTAVGILLYGCKNITIDYNSITGVSTGVFAESSPNGGIVVDNNQFKNMMGPFPRGQFVQFNGVSGFGNSISNNKCENITGASNPEDAINFYVSNGTAESPIMISRNWIRGGVAASGGIVLGINGGSYQTAQNNILVNPGSTGMAIAGGTNMAILNNQIYAAKSTFTNVGVYVWNESTGACSIINVSGNQVNWTNSLGVANEFWDSGNCGTVTGWNTNTWAANINASILPVTF